MKKYISIIICIVMIVTAFSACSKAGSTENKNDKLTVVTTIFPEYDWVRTIAGDKADITMLLDNGVDLHSYQPTADDIIKISTCDIFIYVGGTSDSWVKDTLGEAVNKDMTVINLLDVLGNAVKEEEAKEGMEQEDEADEAEEGPEYDEHVWLSLKNAALLCSYISEKLCEKDPANADYYKSNTEIYLEKINMVDSDYVNVTSANKKTLVFGDRFPFRYLVDDYGLDYYAAFAGCSAETEASFKTIMFLAGKVDELGLSAVLCIENSKSSIAETIKENTKTKDQKILSLNSMQSVTSQDVETGATYIGIMQDNLEVLKEALK
ncbi:MAG: zinc ABC transporter substrate-binding protein [Clostridia bacterium]|nr:zinc ABC transporter substrate-binding protein [Clostridia bacterium]